MLTCHAGWDHAAIRAALGLAAQAQGLRNGSNGHSALEASRIVATEDVSDRLDAAHSANERRRVVAETPRWTPAREHTPGRAATPRRVSRFGDLLREPEETTAWLIEERLPMGGISLLAGNPRRARVPRRSARRCAVTSGCSGLAVMRTCGSSSRPPRGWTPPAPGGHRARAARAHRRGPLAPMVRVRDANDYAVGTAALEPLVTLARETVAPVLAVHHEGKLTRDGGDGIIGYRLLRRRGYGPSPAAV